METKDLIQIKKQRIREELEKLVPPGFHLFPPPKNRTEVYDKLDQFLGRDADFTMQVGYLSPTDKGYNFAYQNLRFFGGKLENYTDYLNRGAFYNDPELNKNLKEVCDYLIRFYELAEITIKRINDEEDVRLQLLQKQKDKEQQQLEQSEEKKKKASGFISGATSFRPGKTVKFKTVKLTGIIPKRSTPQDVVEKISKPQLEAVETEEGISGSKRIVSSLGRLALSLEQTSDNIERVFEVMSEDIAKTREINKKEVDEYRKRVANRGRRIGKKDLGDNKVDVSNVVKKYVGSFFSGTGGAIRSLALFNMLEKFMSGDPLGAIGPLLGIGATYLPAIGGMIAGMLGKKVLGGLLGATKGAGVSRGGAAAARGVGAGLPKLGKFGAIAGLGAGALALGSGLFSSKKEETTTQQQRLDELETEQKALVSPEGIGAIPDTALKKFESLNIKFEKALDFLLKKQKEQPTQQQGRGGSGGGGPGQIDPNISNMSSLTGIHKQAADIIAGYESATSGGYNAMNRGIGGDSPEGSKHYFGKNLTEMTIGEVIGLQNQGGLNAAGRYQFVGNTLPTAMRSAGLNPDDKFSELNQDKMFLSHFMKEGPKPWTGPWGLGKYSQQQLDILERARKTPVAPILPQSAIPTPLQSPTVQQKPKREPNVSTVPQVTPNIIALGLPSQNQEPTPLSASDSGGTETASVSTSYDNIYKKSAQLNIGVIPT
jgi:hypothetical protein